MFWPLNFNLPTILRISLTIDEGLCAFHGRVHFRVYIKNKPHRYGIKINELCEASSGYAWTFEVYTGKRDEQDGQDGQENVSPTNALVNRLIDPYLNKGHTLFVDRFFSSPQLFDDLFNEGTKAVGTVNSNRKGLPKQAFSQSLCKGDHIFCCQDHLLAVKWKDVRDVYMLSSKHKVVLLQHHARGAHEKVKPAAVLDYNLHKLGVDRSDQLISYYGFSRKSIKWWKKLFFHFLDLTIANAYILYNKS